MEAVTANCCYILILALWVVVVVLVGGLVEFISVSFRGSTFKLITKAVILVTVAGRQTTTLRCLRASN